MAGLKPFRRFLADWMLENDRTQVQLARELGLHQTVISRWLHPDARRRARPARRQFDRLVAVLGVSQESLTGMIAADRVQMTIGDSTKRLARNFVQAYGTGASEPDPDLVKLAVAWPRLKASVREAMIILADAGVRGVQQA